MRLIPSLHKLMLKKAERWSEDDHPAFLKALTTLPTPKLFWISVFGEDDFFCMLSVTKNSESDVNTEIRQFPSSGSRARTISSSSDSSQDPVQTTTFDEPITLGDGDSVRITSEFMVPQ